MRIHYGNNDGMPLNEKDIFHEQVDSRSSARSRGLDVGLRNEFALQSRWVTSYSNGDNLA